MNETTDKSPFMLTDTQYNLLKWVVGIVIPAIGTLYFAVAKIWSLPAGEQVLGTLIATQAFLGAVLGVSTRQYKNSDARFDGTLTTTDTPKKTIVSVDTKLHPDDLAQKDEVLLKVK